MIVANFDVQERDTASAVNEHKPRVYSIFRKVVSSCLSFTVAMIVIEGGDPELWRQTPNLDNLPFLFAGNAQGTIST